MAAHEQGWRIDLMKRTSLFILLYHHSGNTNALNQRYKNQFSWNRTQDLYIISKFPAVADVCWLTVCETALSQWRHFVLALLTFEMPVLIRAGVFKTTVQWGFLLFNSRQFSLLPIKVRGRELSQIKPERTLLYIFRISRPQQSTDAIFCFRHCNNAGHSNVNNESNSWVT